MPPATAAVRAQPKPGTITRMSDRPFTLDLAIAFDEVPGEPLLVERVLGHEAISRLYDYEVHVTTDAALDARALVSTGAKLLFLVDGQPVRQVNGIVTESEELYGAKDNHYVFRIGPRLSRSSLVETLDVFMDATVPDIVVALLERVGLTSKDYAFRLEGRYPKREFVVQYKETDLAFLSRLLEHLGISYFFEHIDGRDVVVFVDDARGFRPTPGLREARLSPMAAERAVFSLAARTRATPARYVMRDYNYRNPKVDLTAQADIADAHGGGIVEYGAHFKTPDEGKALARIRAEEQLAARRTLAGKSRLHELTAGGLVKLLEHPRGEIELLVVSVDFEFRAHGIDASRVFESSFTAVETGPTYRPARATPKPRIPGVVTGFVEAESADSKYAKVDDHGRYTVRFVFDTTGPDGKQAVASRPIRMAQPHAGPGYGMHFPLRGGIEVLVTFLDGDPDRPIISATVPNALTPSPVASGNKERNVVRTGSGNEINMDDTHGSERIKLSSPHHAATIQLGAPNAPEVGVAISTMSNVSSVSGSTANTMTTVANSASMYANGWGNHVLSLAGLNNTYALFSMGVAELGNALGLVQSICTDVADGYQADYAVKQDQSNRSLAARQDKESDLDSAIDGIPACCLPANASPDPKQALQSAIAAYKQAADQVEVGWATLAGDQQTQQDPLHASTPTTQAAADAAVATDQSNIGEESDDCWSTDQTKTYTLGQDANGNPTTYYQARYMAKKNMQASYRSLASQISADTPSCPNCSKAKSALDQAFGAYGSACDDLETKRKNEREANPANNRTCINATNAATSVGDVASMIAGAAGVALPIWSLYSTVTGTGMMAYAAGGCDLMRKEALEQFKGDGTQLSWSDSDKVWTKLPAHFQPGSTKVKEKAVDRKTDLGDKYGRVARIDWGAIEGMKQPLGSPLSPAFWKSEQWQEARNLVGSDEHAYFWGRKVAFIGGQECAVLTSRDRVLITSTDTALLHSRGKTEVAAGELLNLTSAKAVDVASRGTVKIAATKDVKPPAAAAELSRLELKDKSAELIVKADGSDGTMTLKVDDEVSVSLDQSGKSADIKAKNKATLTTDKATITSKEILLDAGASGKITLKCGSFQVEITEKGVSIGKSNAGQYAPGLMIKDNQIVVGAGPASLLKVTSAAATLQNGAGKLQVTPVVVKAEPMFDGG